MRSHNEDAAADEQDVTFKYLDKRMDELPEDLVRQLMELEVTTDADRMEEKLKRRLDR
ncbi:MAG TPA: hypothetical protein PKN93_16455 [Leptospiraceae bacterium]|nr:hypothetical protein [Leptospiraceae bacterium]HNN76247.1 hypothetical protein [Leptospiraceae bacterium]